ncbi:SRPBCC family protein [Streptomyces sp. NPDC056549]|uniref:SRPBCC family protein n=1 Tax=Streptomyces sp. NPDC056549 TaxID=3345864 RepID=UPI0036CDFFA9
MSGFMAPLQHGPTQRDREEQAGTDDQMCIRDPPVQQVLRSESGRDQQQLAKNQRFSYEQAAGLFASHRGPVDLVQAPYGGTDITWSATYRHALPLLDMLRRRRLRNWVHDLASYANSIASLNS